MKKLVVLTGAGISAESGIKTFRDSNGLWEGYDIMEVASAEGFKKNPKLVLHFYNERRKQLLQCKPNAAHYTLVELEQFFDITVITQNVDNLHECAGSKNILHLHGELLKSRSTKEPMLIYEQLKDINIGDKCDLGSQLRPHIVWFNENVPLIDEAIKITSSADIFVIIGTSLAVYPAAGLLHYCNNQTPIFVIDKNMEMPSHIKNLTFIKDNASSGVQKLKTHLMAFI